MAGGTGSSPTKEFGKKSTNVKVEVTFAIIKPHFSFLSHRRESSPRGSERHVQGHAERGLDASAPHQPGALRTVPRDVWRIVHSLPTCTSLTEDNNKAKRRTWTVKPSEWGWGGAQADGQGCLV